MDTWNPEQYRRFDAERRQPFDEIVDRCEPVPGGIIYDLGCGPGNLTAELPARLGARTVIGIDNSPAMLQTAQSYASDRVRFEQGDVANFHPAQKADLILANGALQWVDNHEVVLRQWRDALLPGGQLALQIPDNGNHPAFRAVSELSGELAHWFADGRAVGPVSDNVGSPEAYARWLWRLQPKDFWVTMRVFTHVFDDRSAVLEWLKGSSLTRVREALDDDVKFANYLSFYERRLDRALPHDAPFLFTYNRILAWACF